MIFLVFLFCQFSVSLIKIKVNKNDLKYSYLIVLIFYFLVYELGGRHHLRVQPGERQQLLRHLQLLCQDGSVQEHPGDTSHSSRNTG